MEEALRNAGFSSQQGGGGGGGGARDDQAKEAQREQMEMAKNSMLKQILTTEAKERLERVRMVKPENARAVEEHVIRLARGGKLHDKVDEDTLKKMLEEVSTMADEARAGAGGVVKKVVIVRKKGALEDDDDDDDF